VAQQTHNDGISNATLNRDIGTLKSVMAKASKCGFIQESPLNNLKLSKIDRSPKVGYLSVEEETRLRQTLLEREHPSKQERINTNK
jgi:hypothetical protein